MRIPALAAGYALLLWAFAWALRRRAGKPGRGWLEADRVAFERVIALVPLAVADAVLLGAAAWARTVPALVLLGPVFAAITWSGLRELVALRARSGERVPGK